MTVSHLRTHWIALTRTTRCRSDRSTPARLDSWVQYDWTDPVSVNKVDIYWAVDRPLPG